MPVGDEVISVVGDPLTLPLHFMSEYAVWAEVATGDWALLTHSWKGRSVWCSGPHGCSPLTLPSLAGRFLKGSVQ